MIKNIKWLLLVSLTFVACNNDDETIVSNSSDGAPLTSGTADFSKYVALGNSLTAGFSDGALFIEGQKGSYTNILAQQFAQVDGGEFKIPFMADNVGGLLFGGAPNPSFGPRLFFDGCGPVPVTGSSTTETFAPNSGGLFNNMGVPGAKSFHLIFNGYGNPAGLGTVPATANPYYVRIASNPNKSVLEDAMAQSPTFFSLWIGNNDVLGYALAGGDPTIDAITPTATFDFAYSTLVNTLTSNGAKGVIANIPYVTSIPQFTTISVKPVNPNSYFKDTDEPNCSVTYPISAGDIATINAINSSLMSALSSILPDRFSLLSTTANNPLIIQDESLEDKGATIVFAATNSGNPTLVALANYLGATYGKARQSNTGDLIPLTTRGVIGTQNTNLPVSILQAGLGAYGITFPLPDRHVLVPSEIAELKTATDAYNSTIKSLADSKGLAFVDANSVLNEVATKGVSANGFTLRSTYVTGGAFSLDGVHPGPRGYALIANEFIKSINAKYGSNLKGVDLGNYRILFPANPQAF